MGVTLFEHAVAVTPDNFVAHDNLGVELDRRGRADEALAHYRETLRLRPTTATARGISRWRASRRGSGSSSKANMTRRWLPCRRDCATSGDNALAHTYVGLILTAQGKPAAAVPALQTALGIDPALARAHMGLAVALEALGKGVEARREFAETLRLDASNVEAHYDLGLIMARMGEDRAALGEFDAAIRLKPDFGPAHVARAYTLYALGMFAEADPGSTSCPGSKDGRQSRLCSGVGAPFAALALGGTGLPACQIRAKLGLFQARVTAPSLALETNLQYFANTPAL